MPRNTPAAAPAADTPAPVEVAPVVTVEGVDITVDTLSADDVYALVETLGEDITPEQAAMLATRLEDIDAEIAERRKAAARKAADARKSAEQRRTDARAALMARVNKA